MFSTFTNQGACINSMDTKICKYDFVTHETKTMIKRMKMTL